MKQPCVPLCVKAVTPMPQPDAERGRQVVSLTAQSGSPHPQQGIIPEACDNPLDGDDADMPPWRCPGPVAAVLALPHRLSAALFRRCEARLPGSVMEPCDDCWAALRTGDAS